MNVEELGGLSHIERVLRNKAILESLLVIGQICPAAILINEHMSPV